MPVRIVHECIGSVRVSVYKSGGTVGLYFCLTLSTVVILSVSVVGSKGLANSFSFARLP